MAERVNDGARPLGGPTAASRPSSQVPPPVGPLAYRPDVDGLRAVAVTLVVAYHVGFRALSGGFIGVDVFFVISGYLITAILWREMDTAGRIEWGRFYARRVRRLLPALTVVVLVTLAVGVAVLVPNPDLRWLGQSTIAVTTFLSNVYFYLKTGSYFGSAAESLPLLNTWSLAVEEQFYIVWPLVLLVCWRLRRRFARVGVWWPALVMGSLTLLSLVAAQIMVGRNQSAAFFLMPFRLWELAVGGLLAVYGHHVPTMSRRVAAAIAGLGLVLISASALLLDGADPFPGFLAVPCILGTLLVIVGGSGSAANVVSSGLSLRPLVKVGALSYSWYLIHWPLLVYAEMVTQQRDLARDTIVALVALLLAAASYRWIERPFRAERFAVLRGTRPTLIAGVALLGIMAVAGGVVTLRAGQVSRLEVSAPERVVLRNSMTAYRDCPPSGTAAGEAVDCQFGDGPRRLLVMGDSHSIAHVPIAREFAQEQGWSVDVLWDTSCPFVIEFEAPPGGEDLDAECLEQNRQRLEYLRQNRSEIAGVVMTARSSSFMYRDDGTPIDGAAESWGDAVRATAGELERLGIPVVFVLDGPTYPHDVPRCLIYREGGCDLTKKEAEEFRAPSADAERAALEGMPLVRVWDSFDALCSAERCPVEQKGQILYRDPDHLSDAGSKLISEELARVMSEHFSGQAPGG